MRIIFVYIFFFFFNDTATTEIYTLSLHDALPIDSSSSPSHARGGISGSSAIRSFARSEEHTSELQSRVDLVCRLLLEKTNDIISNPINSFLYLLLAKYFFSQIST